MPGRAADLQAALRLTYLTLVWMTVEGGAALWLGRAAHSLLLDSFGLDSVVEMGSAGVLLWRLRVEARGRADAARVERAERRASVVAGCLCCRMPVLPDACCTGWRHGCFGTLVRRFSL